jgi:serine/threonine-protein kinase HipA
VALPKLLSAAEHVMDETDTDEDLQLLFAPGSSLGGARPKASVREKDGQPAIAKFPRKDDETNTVIWEAVALRLAHKAEIAVPVARVETLGVKPVLLLRRFDPNGKRRIPFLSAMSMLSAKDNESHSYLEIVDALRQNGAAPKADIEALWQRIVFNILISNTDDHLRNHGFLCQGSDGWLLSPAYDLNPVPTDIKPRILTTAINEVMAPPPWHWPCPWRSTLNWKPPRRVRLPKQVGKAVSAWRNEAARHAVGENEIDRMASAFEHEDLKDAVNG